VREERNKCILFDPKTHLEFLRIDVKIQKKKEKKGGNSH
jgi:hypothetical protein